MSPFKTATVLSHQTPASTYHDVVIQLHDVLPYKPGQYLSIKVGENLLRSYSIAGILPNNQMGLIVDHKPGGPGSQFFQALKPGDTFPFLGPLGIFFLHPDDGAQQIIFLGTGSGIAPLKAMIEAALREHHTQIPLKLYFGLRYEGDIFWDTYFKELVAQYPNLEYHLCLSRPEGTWTGEQGHITDIIDKAYADLSLDSAYLCGNGKMIEEAKELLARKNMPKERIYHEKFF